MPCTLPPYSRLMCEAVFFALNNFFHFICDIYFIYSRVVMKVDVQTKTIAQSQWLWYALAYSFFYRFSSRCVPRICHLSWIHALFARQWVNLLFVPCITPLVFFFVYSWNWSLINWYYDELYSLSFVQIPPVLLMWIHLVCYYLKRLTMLSKCNVDYCWAIKTACKELHLFMQVECSLFFALL